MNLEDKIEILKKEIEKLKKLYKNEQNSETKAYYLGEICSLANLYTEITKKQIKLGYKTYEYNQIKKFQLEQLHNFKTQVMKDSYRNYIDNLCTNATNIFYDYNYDYIDDFNTKFSINNCMKIIYDFIDEINPNLYNKLKSIIEDKLFFIKGEIYDESYSVGNSQIVIYYFDKINIETIQTIVHELGHIIYSSKFVKKQFNKDENNFIETLPYLFEQLFNKFCKKNKIAVNDCITCENNDLSCLEDNLYSLKIINHFIKTKYIQSDYFEIPSLELNKVDNRIITKSQLYQIDNIRSPYIYSYGMLLSVYYARAIEKDPQLAKYNIENFLENIGIKSDIYILNNFGINFDEFIKCEYLESKIKKLEKIKKAG